jgi:hypothetical protein
MELRGLRVIQLSFPFSVRCYSLRVVKDARAALTQN